MPKESDCCRKLVGRQWWAVVWGVHRNVVDSGSLYKNRAKYLSSCQKMGPLYNRPY